MQELDDEKSRALAKAKLTAAQQAIHQKESEVQALQAEHLQAQVCQAPI